jgi:hypothetical protein
VILHDGLLSEAMGVETQSYFDLTSASSQLGVFNAS